MKERILIIEDDRTFSAILMNRLGEDNTYDLMHARTYAEAAEILDTNDEFFISVVDLHLPDSHDGEIVDLVRTHRIPIIVTTADISVEFQKFIWSKNIVDYVIKEGIHILDYIQNLIARISNNRQIKVLVVDDSRSARMFLRNLLEVHLYHVHEAATGAEALEILSENDDIKLVIVDYNMPGMNGVELTRRIRRGFATDRMGIIGISSHDNPRLSVDFIKHGANDFITKPFYNEQLYCRVTQNISIIEQFGMIRELSNSDYLTRLHNRRHLFSAGEVLFGKAKRAGTPLILAMIDIDHFKNINDTFGHEAGDAVLVWMAEMLKSSFRKPDLVARYGGEEFCVIASNMNRNDAEQLFDRLCREIEGTAIPHEGREGIHVTVSIGVCSELRETLGIMISEADTKLYEAKRAGRNRVIA